MKFEPGTHVIIKVRGDDPTYTVAYTHGMVMGIADDGGYQVQVMAEEVMHPGVYYASFYDVALFDKFVFQDLCWDILVRDNHERTHKDMWASWTDRKGYSA